MKTTLLVLGLACGLAGMVAAESPEDGLYARSEAPDARKVTDAGDREYGLGQKLAYTITEARLTARDNLNSDFSLSLKVPDAKGLDAVRHVLVVKGTAYGQNSSGSDGTGTFWIGFQFAGRENAGAVAAHFGIKPELRAHPGHRLEVAFVPAQKSFEPGGANPVTLRIRNIGAESVFFQVGGRNRSVRDNQFVFRASNGDKALPDIGTDMNFGGLSVIRELKPGEVFEKEVDLAKWFAFEKPGVYFVHGSYLLEFFETREYTRVLWEDWATADFTVTIAEKAR